MRLTLTPKALLLAALAPFALVVACGGGDDKSKTPSGARASCQADADCVVTTEQVGCCAACPDKPHAIPQLSFEQHKNACVAASCPAPSDRIECPQVDSPLGYVATCDHGTCAAIKK